MKVILDTCIVSEAYRNNVEPAVRSAVDRLGDAAYISVVTIGEVSRGAHLLKAEDPRRPELLDWLRWTEQLFAKRTLSVDADVARLWGEVSVKTRRMGREVQMADGLIAATALHHGMAMMTRNVKDFVPTGVEVIDPWPTKEQSP